MNDLRERVARAIYDRSWMYDRTKPWTLAPENEKRLCYEMADAALAEIGAVRVKPLVWDDFEGQGAKASGFYQANYLITKWRGRGEFEVAMSYPGYQTGFDGERFHPTLEAAKAAAQADYEARILAAIEPAPVSVREAARVLAEKLEAPFEHADMNARDIDWPKVWADFWEEASERDAPAAMIAALRAIAEGKE